MNPNETNSSAASHAADRSEPTNLFSVIAGLFHQGGFLVVVLVLCAAAVGLNASVQFLQLHFKKESVPMRTSFAATEPIPVVVGTWVQVARDETLNAEMLAALGTNEFLFCYYINSAVVGMTPDEIRRQFIESKKSVEVQKTELAKIQKRHPNGVLAVSMTYYTGKADTVAHIPERCYVGEGFDPVNPANELWDLDRNLSVRHILFHSTTRTPCDVAYFFHTNGHYESDSLMVRATLQNLFARYGYYAKIELMCNTEDQQASAAAMRDFLAQALPAVEKSLPDWTQYQGKK